MELPPQLSRKGLEASHEENSGETSDSSIKLEENDDIEKDENRFTPNRTSSFKSFRY
jgi:hypothetical protein